MHADDGGGDAIVGAEVGAREGEVRIGDVRLLILFPNQINYRFN